MATAIWWIRWMMAGLLIIGAITFFVTIVWRRITFIRLGVPVPFVHSKGNKKQRTGFVPEVVAHQRLLQDWRSGVMHLFYFYGFIMLQLGAIDMLYSGLTARKLWPASWYTTFSTIQEVTILLVLGAVGYGIYRRYAEKLDRLKRGRKPAVVYWLIGALLVTVVATSTFEKLIISMQPVSYAPVSSSLAAMLEWSGVAHNSWIAYGGYELFWWLHLLILLAFLIYIPLSKHFHLLTAPINIWFRRGDAATKLTKLNLEDENAETFGVSQVEQFTQKQLLDLYACVECGRCTDVCPAASTGKLLSPMHLITKMRDHLTEKGAAITSTSPWLPQAIVKKRSKKLASANSITGSGSHRMGDSVIVWDQLIAAGKLQGDHLRGMPHEERIDATDERWRKLKPNIVETMLQQEERWRKDGQANVLELELIGDVITEEELWSCTTCRNCEQQCPVGNEHVDKIIDLRRHLVLMEGKMPQEMQRTLVNIERQGNPWGLARAERAKWMEECEQKTGIRVRTLKELSIIGEEPDIVLWAGSMGAYDLRSRKVLFDLVRLLDAAGVSFATAGNEERSSGDTARRIGNEMLFQQLCEENIALMKRYNIRKIVTACPHTYHVFTNEYSDFDLPAGMTIFHHSQLLAQLLAEGKLRPKYEVIERVTIHDPCYLGRYNDAYDPPRQLLAAIPGVMLQEMTRSGRNAMCCGAGGGMMWLEETKGMRVNYARTAQALEVEPSVIGSACPYCLTMMEDGIKALKDDGSVIARDVAELLAESVCGKQQHSSKETYVRKVGG